MLPWERRCIEADIEFANHDRAPVDLLLRAVHALGLEIAAVDYADLADGGAILWEANPHFLLPPLDHFYLVGPRQLRRRYDAMATDAFGDLLRKHFNLRPLGYRRPADPYDGGACARKTGLEWKIAQPGKPAWLSQNAPVAQWIEQRFPKPCAQVRFLSGASGRSRRAASLRAETTSRSPVIDCNNALAVGEGERLVQRHRDFARPQ